LHCGPIEPAARPDVCFVTRAEFVDECKDSRFVGAQRDLSRRRGFSSFALDEFERAVGKNSSMTPGWMYDLLHTAGVLPSRSDTALIAATTRALPSDLVAQRSDASASAHASVPSHLLKSLAVKSSLAISRR
jgi:hypothetical protein